MRINTLVRRWSALMVLVMTTGLWASLFAAPLPPPLLCVDDDDCVQTLESTQPPPPSSGGDDYTLADATAGLPFTLNTPIPPTITSEVTVTPSTIQSNKVNGRRLILAPGNYGNQTFGTTDQEIVIQPGVEIDTLNIDRTARRLHFRGEPARAGRIRRVNTGGSWNNGMTDLLFEGVYVDDTGTPGENNQLHGIRVAVINSLLRSSQYAMGNFHELTDFLLANSHVHTYGTTQANMRTHSPLRYVVVDSRLQKTGSGHHTLRIHGSNVGDRPADQVYIARNQFDGARVAIRGSGEDGENAGTSIATAGIATVWFVDNVMHQPLGNASLYAGNNTHDSDRPQMMYIRDNVLYSNNSPFVSPGQPRANWVMENNVQFPYQDPPQNMGYDNLGLQ